MSSLEMISILSKQWASVNDIKQIACCGRDKASQIRNDICKQILKEGKFLPICKEKLVPMDRVISHLNINLDYIYDMAKKEKNLI